MSGAKTEHLSDEQRAGSPFPIKKEELVELVREYKSRKYDEDIKGAENLGSAEGLSQKLKTDLKNGLSGIDFVQRTAAFGNNEREDQVAKTFCSIFLEALDDFMMKVLLVAATASLVFGYIAAKPEDYGHVWIDSFAIYLAVLVVSGVGSIVDYLKEKEFTKRANEENANIKLPVIREGKEIMVHVNYLHVGDVIVLKVGQVIPVDGIVISSEQLSTNEAAMTGESDPCKKESTEDCLQRRVEYEAELGDTKQGATAAATSAHALPSPVILSGTEVVAGKGYMLVVMVGDSSAIGEIMSKLKNKTGQTPLQKKLTIIAENVGLLGTYFALLTVHVLMVRYFIDGVNKRQIILFDTVDDRLTFWTELLQWVEFFTIGVAVVVVAIPEGLPLAVMLSLAYSQRMMLKDNNNVKKLAACEIMGGATNICSDKTGTLTLNQMKVTKVWLGKDIDIPIDQNEVTKEMLPIKPADFFPESLWKVLEMAIACNIPPADDYSATDKGMADLLSRAGTDLQGMQDKYLADSTRFHFTSKRKRMSTIVAGAGDNGSKRLFIKGASEMVKNCCSSYLDANGVVQPMNDQINSELDSQIYNYADQALRTIAVAYKDVAENEGGKNHDDPMNEEVKTVEKSGLILIGILGIMDVIRSEVPRSVAQCVEAGIIVRMVTGDNIVTARAIAKLCNILNVQEAADEACCMEGPAFYEAMGGLVCAKCKKATPGDCTCDEKDKLDNERVRNMNKFKAIAPKLKVMARSRPEDKYLMVTGLRNCDEVVAVTGDGTNDAPALSKADVGFGMGVTGTQVCKAAADIIIVDDSFTSVVKAASWGRNVFDNIQRFLQFQLTVNVNALITVFICSALMKGTPLQAIQLLWVNLIMDSLAALALATENPKPHLLQRPPQKSDDYIVSRKMTKHILYMAIYQFILIFVIVFFGEWFIPEDMPEHQYPENPCCVKPGREFDVNGEPLWFAERQVNGNEYSRHITFVFHFFVLMQIWNMIACRKIHDEWNIFEGMSTNYTFVVIWFIIVILQFTIIETGSVAFRLSPDGLSMTQQLYAVVLAFTVFPINAILKCVPDRFGPKLGEDSVFERNEKKRLGTA